MTATKIDWAEKTWNITTGCTKVSPGCANCYAARLAATRLKHHPMYEGLARKRDEFCGWTGEVRLHPEKLEEPLHWRKPRRVFVCATSDLFHESVPKRFIWQAWATAARCPQHTFIVLTKRPQRMYELITSTKGNTLWSDKFHDAVQVLADFPEPWQWPLPNVWLGVTAEDQQRADERIPVLLETPAAVRFVSYEPAIAPVDIRKYLSAIDVKACGLQDDPLAAYMLRCAVEDGHGDATRLLDWVILGGESGPNARPMHPDWVRSVRDQCASAGVPFFFKQWGEWGPIGPMSTRQVGICACGWHGPITTEAISRHRATGCDGATKALYRVGKKQAGHLLDGVEHREYPEVRDADA